MTEALVLAYHAVSETWDDELAVTPHQLESQLRLLVDRGYRGVTFSEAASSAPAERLVAVTFDDAYRSTIAIAFAALEELGLPGTVFVPTAFVGGDAPMQWPGIDRWIGTEHEHELLPVDWDSLCSLADAGWEIGSHTCSHPMLTSLGDDALAYELGTSRRVLVERLGRSCTSLAYPYGLYDARVIAAARHAGYRFACGLPSGFARATELSWPRIGVYRDDSPRAYRLKISETVRRLRRSHAWRPIVGARRLVTRLASNPAPARPTRE